MTAFAYRSKFLVVALVVLTVASVRARTPEAAATLVLYNTNDSDSQSLAAYYASKRDIAPDRVVGLNCPLSEQITRDEFNATIAAPLTRMFRDQGWWTMGRDAAGQRVVTATSVRFVAIMRGMPLKVALDPTLPPATFVNGMPELIATRNDASVDSELSVLGLAPPSPGGLVPNPYFQRFTPILDDPVPAGILLPARLDGPTPQIVRAMIDDALQTERTGLYGWGYVDARGITSGGYAEGDKWLGNLRDAMRRQGIPVIFDNNPATFPPGFPVTDAAAYFGWYAGAVDGPFADPAFAFVRGAVAVHIHSFSAATLRDVAANWCAPLLARGAAATLGNVYEPYLSLTANLDVFQDRLMNGMTFAESAWIAQRALSWMSVAVGDPLYRPYAAWARMPSGPVNTWQTYRRIVLNAGGVVLSAAGPLEQEARNSSNGMFLEALGAVQADSGDNAAALKSFEAAATLTAAPAVKLRIDLERMAALRALGRLSDATALAETSAAQAPNPAVQQLLRSEETAVPSTADAPSLLAGEMPSSVPAATATPSPTPDPTPAPTPLPPPVLPVLPP